jgi:hypothetical protein
MTSAKNITPELLLWAEILLLGMITSYGVSADPLKEEAQEFRWRAWGAWLSLRLVLVGFVSYSIGRSLLLSAVMILAALLQPLIRSRLPMQWVAEFECFWMLALIVLPLTYIRHAHLASHWHAALLNDARMGAVCLAAATLLFIIRGGTYIVRGILRKAGTLPSQKDAIVAEIAAVGPAAPLPDMEAIEADLTASEVELGIDVKELNRGRLIGNLERIVLTLVVAGGSYSALGFLIAAKGLVRFEEFEKSREFTEYFLVGSLSSVLVALCAGLLLRHALLALWPELLAFQMQS